MAPISPYRSLPVDKRVTLVTHDIGSSRDAREIYIQRIIARGGGFRRETVRKWPPAQLAREIVRYGLETPPQEIGLLQTMYVELEPEIQMAFLEATGVPHEGASIADDLEPPFADAGTVATAARALVAQFGDRARHYLETIARYNGEAWPGLADLLPELG